VKCRSAVSRNAASSFQGSEAGEDGGFDGVDFGQSLMVLTSPWVARPGGVLDTRGRAVSFGSAAVALGGGDSREIERQKSSIHRASEGGTARCS
jgi:hypothetical protein